MVKPALPSLFVRYLRRIKFRSVLIFQLSNRSFLDMFQCWWASQLAGPDQPTLFHTFAQSLIEPLFWFKVLTICYLVYLEKENNSKNWTWRSIWNLIKKKGKKFDQQKKEKIWSTKKGKNLINKTGKNDDFRARLKNFWEIMNEQKIFGKVLNHSFRKIVFDVGVPFVSASQRINIQIYSF